MANLPPGQGSGAVSGSTGPQDAGVPNNQDPTWVPGQQPSDLFGVRLPSGTGAPGTSGAGGGSDPTNEPGQLTEGISGSGPSVTSDSGAPGTTGLANGSGGPDHVVYTEPGSFLSGTNITTSVNDSISGTSDWTQAIDGSYGADDKMLPGVAGNQPLAGQGRYQPGSGNVLRGGYRKGQR